MKRSLIFASIAPFVWVTFLNPSAAFSDVLRFTAGDNGPRFSVALSNGSRGIAVGALEKAYDDFIGDSPPAQSNTPPVVAAASTGGSFLIDPEIFDFKGTDYVLREAIELRLAVEQDWQFSKRGFLFGEASAFVGRRRYALPNGAGILLDPISVRFTSVGAELRGGIRQQTNITPSLLVKTDFGGGIQQVKVRTLVQSALLDVRSTSDQTRPFIEIGVALEARRKRNQWHSFARLRGHKDRTIDVLIGVKIAR